MTRSDHDIVCRLDNTQLLLWPKGVDSISPQTKVATVKNYRGWQVRNRPGGPVWQEYQVDKDGKRFVTPCGLQLQEDEDSGTYGQTVQVATSRIECEYKSYSHTSTCTQSEINELEMKGGRSSYSYKAWSTPAEMKPTNESW